MKDFTEIGKEEVIQMVASGIEVRAIILAGQEGVTKGLNSSMKEQIIRLTTSKTIQDINDVIAHENTVFYIKKEDKIE